jgi:hypothetical protein
MPIDPRPPQKPPPQTNPQPLRVPLFDLTKLPTKKEEEKP